MEKIARLFSYDKRHPLRYVGANAAVNAAPAIAVEAHYPKEVWKVVLNNPVVYRENPEFPAMLRPVVVLVVQCKHRQVGFTTALAGASVVVKYEFLLFAPPSSHVALIPLLEPRHRSLAVRNHRLVLAELVTVSLPPHADGVRGATHRAERGFTKAVRLKKPAVIGTLNKIPP